MEENILVWEEKDLDGIGLGLMESGSGSMDEDVKIADGLSSNEILLFWPILACLSRDWGVG